MGAIEHWYADDENNPCLDCGVCCTHFRISFYQGETASLGGSVPDELVSRISPFLVAMKGTEHGKGRCIALSCEGKCSIYSARPSSCREYPAVMENGLVNPKCLELKKSHGLIE